MSENNKARSLKMLAEGVKDSGVYNAKSFNIDPRKIQIEPGFNRDIDPEHVESFRRTIRSGGIIPPVFVRVENGIMYMVDGGHRLAAYLAEIEAGAAIDKIAAVNFAGNDADRVLMLLTSSQGKPLEPIERAHAYVKLLRMNRTPAQIAEGVGKSEQHVRELIRLATEANSDVHAHIKAGEVSATEAAKIVKEHGPQAGPVIAERLEAAKARGKRKVTAASAPVRKERLPESARLVIGALLASLEEMHAMLNKGLPPTAEQIEGAERVMASARALLGE